MNRADWMLQISLAAGIALALLGCSSANSGAPSFNPATGTHPAGWAKAHGADYLKSPAQCLPCHGSATDPKAPAGTSKVSCFACHPTGISHPDGWAAASQHGRKGAQAAVGASTGLAQCFKCHSATPVAAGAVVPSCLTCHTRAPHSDQPWNGASAATPNHTFTDISNAPACFTCHAGGSNSRMKPSEPAPSGTEPGCFNNTMCHGKSI